ncbi:anthrax toxin receptor-like [Dasypus novemcinctus]|uniref:anthrax toxin receptor-like n=1 Tax=Dasypus novemcinctus TaxID=9361 RepID=UPI0039C9EF3F
MDKGFEMANDQIAKATAGGKKVSSMIIAFTDGTLEPVVFSNTKSEARKARHMGATIYAVGVKDFLQSQLEGFADTKEHAFGVLGGFKALQSITDKLGEKSCIELKSLDPVVACVGGEYRVVVRGSGLQNTRDKSSVICRFKFTDNSIWDETAITVEEKFITCPGVEMEEPGEKVFVEISLNKGNNFFANNLSFTSVLCGEHPTTPVRNTPRQAQTKPHPKKTTTTMTTTMMTTSIPAKPRKFPLLPVVVGVLSLTGPLLLCCLCYICWPCKKKPPDPCRTVCCSPPRPMVMPARCDCLDTGCLSQMEHRGASRPSRNWCPNRDWGRSDVTTASPPWDLAPTPSPRSQGKDPRYRPPAEKWAGVYLPTKSRKSERLLAY